MQMSLTAGGLRWVSKLVEDRYKAWDLLDEHGRRWGWLVDPVGGCWVAHVGDWGQAQLLGLPSVPLEQDLRDFETVAEAKSWVEAQIAAQLAVTFLWHPPESAN